jgi:serine/threonine protein kinase
MSFGLSEGDYLEGRYKIVQRLGEGGMGVVWEAEHVMLKSRCAVKVLHPREAADGSMIKRFKVEARSAANTRHPNIVEVMDYGVTHDNRPFMVMEFLEGESLADRLDRMTRLNPSTAIEITDQILSGLQAAHRGGVVHRDLKPENIYLVRNEPKGETVKILDFGISKIVANKPSIAPPPVGEDSRHLTEQGMVLGTPGYMAPESLYGTEDVDARADLFSVGVLLYEMLTGQRPFEGNGARAIMVATATEEPVRPSLLRPELHPAMERLTMQGLIKDPDKRFQSAEEFLRKLSAAAVGRFPGEKHEPRTRRGAPAPPSASPQAQRSTPKAAETVAVELDTPSPATGASFASRFGAPDPGYGGGYPPRAESRAVSRGGYGAGGYPGRYDDAPISSKRHGSNRSLLTKLWRWSLAFSPIPLFFLAALGGAAYYYFVYQDPIPAIQHGPIDPIDAEIERNSKRPSGASYDDPDDETRSVILWLDIAPADARVYWNGTLRTERPLVVPSSSVAGELRLRADGYADWSATVTPDKEQTLKVRMIKGASQKKSRGTLKRKRRR